jgi:hypothetical protein
VSVTDIASRTNDKQLTAQAADRKEPWYVNTQGQTFVILDRGDFTMGSPKDEVGHNQNEIQHRRHLSGRFAIAATEVTKAQYNRFQEDVHTQDAKTLAELEPFVPTDDSPRTGVSWFQAAWYCNWLSQQEGIATDSLCYEPNEKQQYAPGMKAKANYLQLTGYRLPTEAEWEFACRAGTTTSRYYGVAESLLPNYACYSANSMNRTRPVASLKPNDWGLFDMLGNALEWCHESYKDYPKVDNGDAIANETVDDQKVDETASHVLRGGSFFHAAMIVRSASRYSYQVNQKYERLGFRPVRTLPPGHD